MCGILVIVGRREVKSKVCCAVVSWVAHLTHIGKYTIYTYISRVVVFQVLILEFVKLCGTVFLSECDVFS